MSKPYAVALAVLTALASGCGGPQAEGSRTEGEGGSGATREAAILVSAAASLTNAFGEVATAFEAGRPAAAVRLNFAGSSTLRTQIAEGAPVDVFASADLSTMRSVVDAGEVEGAPRVFATNALQIAVPSGNPGGVTGIRDFGRSELLLGLCAEAVPCGAFARRVLTRAGVDPAVDTEEPDVRALLTKVELGELDAAITYVTDVAAAGTGVEGVDITDDENVVARYPIAVLAGAPNPDLARAFVEFVLSARGREILARHGFGSP